MKMWGELSLMYLACWLCMMYSTQLFDGFMWLLNAGAKVVLRDVSISEFTYQFDIGKARGAEKIILNLVGGFISILANGIVWLLSFLRFMELYFLRGIAPLFIVCMMNEVTRPIAITFMKYFISVVLVTLALTIISILYPVLFSKSALLVLLTDTKSGVAIVSLFEGICYIIAILGAGRKMQRLMGV